MTIRSFLFVPGDSDRKLAKGAESGADALILDLEDSVAPDRKPAARGLVAEALAQPRGAGPELWVRINPLDTGGMADLVAVVRAGPAGLVIPKPDGPAVLARISAMLDVLELREGVVQAIRLMPVATETARAPFALGAYADAGLTRLWGLTWGGEDLATALGARTNRGPDGGWAFTYRMVRSATLMAARAAGVAPIDTLHADFRDEAGLIADSRAAAAEGFTGRLAIHPAQCAPINAAFTPSAEDIAHAERVVAAFAAAPGIGVVGIDGRMYDIPHLRQAEAVLAQASALAARGRG
ncbi:MAG: HpcH/HpaI aldolase/citrate lyase family protein [Gemmobacter sp.]